MSRLDDEYKAGLEPLYPDGPFTTDAPDPMNSPHPRVCNIWKWGACSCEVGMKIDHIPPFTTDPPELPGEEHLVEAAKLLFEHRNAQLLQFGELVRGKVIDSVAQSEHDDWEEYAEQLGGEISVDLHQLLKEFLGEHK